MVKQQDIYNLPNMVSSIRILIAPILFYLAAQKMETVFLIALLFSGATDVLDGYLARKLNQITQLGSHLDSWGDFTIYSTMAFCAWILWPETVQREMIYFSMILFSFLLPVCIGLIKYGRLTSYHTWSVKLAVFFTFIGYVTLFSGLSNWPFVFASFLCVYAGIEEILITLVSKQERADVRSLWAALLHNRVGRNQVD